MEEPRLGDVGDGKMMTDGGRRRGGRAGWFGGRLHGRKAVFVP
jgi:hypothetical protein